MVDNRIPISKIHWKNGWRIVSTRFPTIHLFERIADPDDWEALIEIESLTNDRIRDRVGLIALVQPEDRVSGPGATYIMSPFTHIQPGGSRFSDGSFGVFYAAKAYETAIAETVYHRERFLGYTNEPPTDLEMVALKVEIEGKFHNICNSKYKHYHDPDDYGPSQKLGRELRSSGAWGISFNSVRHARGRCVAVLRPPAIKKCNPAKYLIYKWDGTSMDVFERIK